MAQQPSFESSQVPQKSGLNVSLDTNKQISRQTYIYIYKRMDIYKYIYLGGWIFIGVYIDKCMDGWMETDKQSMYIYL